MWSRFSGTRESKPSYGLVGLSIVVHICIMCKYYIPSRHGTCMYVICFVVSHEQNNRKRKNMCKEFFMTLSRLQQYYFKFGIGYHFEEVFQSKYHITSPYLFSVPTADILLFLLHITAVLSPLFFVGMKYPQHYNEMRLITQYIRKGKWDYSLKNGGISFLILLTQYKKLCTLDFTNIQ